MQGSVTRPSERRCPGTTKQQKPCRAGKKTKPTEQLPTYRLLPFPSETDVSAFPGEWLNRSVWSECDPSVLLLVQHGHRMGLRFWQDVSDPQRIMFDATQFNVLGGYTSSKGIKGDFLTRMKLKLENETMYSEER